MAADADEKNNLHSAAGRGILAMSVGDDDWVPCGVMP